ncbi:exportin-2-like [Macadamia integrifolia]|uniref:exportin-2-like n=1 Tax=Macadamia integrifolia TaxID=60698 RepID=UPI001C4FE4A5|nr:exportin-2-like [Macadamia integrifolia]
MESSRTKSDLCHAIRLSLCQDSAVRGRGNDVIDEAATHHSFILDVLNLAVDTSVGESIQAAATNLFLDHVQTPTLSTNIYNTWFAERLQKIIDFIIIPNIILRDEDIIFFERLYIRFWDMEGSEVDSRRRDACGLLKGAILNFEKPVTGMIMDKMDRILGIIFPQNLVADWKFREYALFLLGFLTSQLGGYIDKYFGPFISELYEDINSFPILRAAFADEERSGREALDDKEQSRFYEPLSLHESLFHALKLPESDDNLYIMKCIMRSLQVSSPTNASCDIDAYELGSILRDLSNEPKNPNFITYLFHVRPLENELRGFFQHLLFSETWQRSPVALWLLKADFRKKRKELLKANWLKKLIEMLVLLSTIDDRGGYGLCILILDLKYHNIQHFVFNSIDAASVSENSELLLMKKEMGEKLEDNKELSRFYEPLSLHESLFHALKLPESDDNLYIMKCIMRSLQVSSPTDASCDIDAYELGSILRDLSAKESQLHHLFVSVS